MCLFFQFHFVSKQADVSSQADTVSFCILLLLRPICQLCGRIGHVALKCYHTFDISFHGHVDGGETGSHQGQSGGHSGQAYLASSDTVADQAWYMDSGATNHVTTDAQNLSTKVDYKGKDKLTVGNGYKLPISHIVSSILPSHVYISYSITI